jgi:hypothetical protein
MVLNARPATVKVARRVRFWALALVGLLVGHTAVYLVEYGSRYSDAMARTGHGYWLVFALLVMVVGGVPLAAASVGLYRLWARVGRSTRSTSSRSMPGTAVRSLPAPSYIREFLGLMPRLLLVILVGFVIQENLEAASVGLRLSGPGVLNDLMTLQVLVAVTALIALAGAWLRWRESILIERLRAIREALAHANAATPSADCGAWAEIAAAVALRWLIARRVAGRAPPVSRAAA